VVQLSTGCPSNGISENPSGRKRRYGGTSGDSIKAPTVTKAEVDAEDAMIYRGLGTGMCHNLLPELCEKHKPLWCMEEERQGEADNPGPPKPGVGPKHTLAFDKRARYNDDQSTDDGASDCSSLEVVPDDPDAEYDPGPHTPWTTSELPAGTVLFESGNCTSFRKHLEHIATKRHHGAVYQEAKVPTADHERLKLALAKTHHRQAIFSDTCPEHAAPAAGLAAIVKHPLQVIRLKPNHLNFEMSFAPGE